MRAGIRTIHGCDRGTGRLSEWAEPSLRVVNVNYVRDADGTARPIAIEGSSDYKTEGAVDVGVMQMSFWWKWDTSNAEYDLITISDLPHPELGLKPWTECTKADGTVLPWCIGSKYISGTASDGKLRSQPGLKPARNQSHNNMITNYQSKGAGYWGAGAERNTFQIIFNLIKGATKSSQSLFAGCTSYNYQYERRCKVQRLTPTSRLQTHRRAILLLEAMYLWDTVEIITEQPTLTADKARYMPMQMTLRF